LKVFFISIFPELIDSLTKNGVIKNALEKSIIEYEILNPLDFLKGKERVDDKPYGGGPGMLMKAQPLENLL
jgi:tRNA (guanine37-N1)-methyltransferase